MKYFESYKEIKMLKPDGLRAKLRSFALDGLYTLDQMKGIEQQLNKPRIQFLYIHHLFADEEIKLRSLMKKLSLNHEFISHSEAITKILEGKIDKPYISISSDDGFKNNIKAAEILNEFGAKGCFFINPSMMEEKSFEKIEQFCKNRIDFLPVEFMNWQDIENLQKMGHEIGSHTMDHINVATTEKEIFIEDCKRTFEILQERCGEAKHFAYPYGRFSNFSEMGREIVFNAGFTSCASAVRGCHINHDRLLSNQELFIRRDHIILDWNINHILHFIINSAKKATISNNLFPYGA